MYIFDEFFDRELQEALLSGPTPHGATFDDRRRWCGRCACSVFPRAADIRAPWADKTCPTCSSLWPEFVELYQVSLLLADEDDVFTGMLH